jgi:hypothetical protein
LRTGREDHPALSWLAHSCCEAVSSGTRFAPCGVAFAFDSTTSVDREVVLPLLKRLQEVYQSEQWVLLRPGNADSAVALFIELPDDEEVVERMAHVVQEADDAYSGFIVQQWGYEWLGIALVDETAYAFLKKVDPNVDKQR